MKKIFSVVFVLILCFSLSITAFAKEADDADAVVPKAGEVTGGDGDSNGEDPDPDAGDGSSSDDYSITITQREGASENHVYDVYQIFTGVLSTDSEGKKVLSNVKYGASYGKEGEAVPEDVLKGIQDANDAKAFADDLVKGGKLGTAVGKLDKGNNYTLKLAAGYYLIIDNTAKDPLGTDNDAYSAYMVQVVGAVTMEPKSNVPEVDKEVYDDENGGGWGETADHEINESFPFKLTATLPEDENFAAYTSYKLVFHDTLSKGISFDGVEKVTINGSTDPLDKSKYVVSAVTTEDDGTKSWTVTIEDLLEAVPGLDLAGGVTVEVIYNAHLNEDAHTTISTENDVVAGSDANTNKVYLEYSNEPYAEGTGRTPEDTVYVFTYKIENVKVKETEDGEALAGAGFTLYYGADDNTDEEEDDNSTALEAVKLYQGDDGNYYVYDKDNAPSDLKEEDIVTEIFSDSEGKFNIYGLDAGTYTLKETTTPKGYNTCDPTIVTISAEHTENEDTGTASVDLTKASNLRNVIVNKSGTILPSTGGIGTTIFYIAGGILVVGAGVLLIIKKRMNK